HFDIVIAADFRLNDEMLQHTMEEVKVQQKMGLRTGLVQMARYDLNVRKPVHPEIRRIVNGNDVQMLVYGEDIECEILIVKQASILEEKQVYIPDLRAHAVRVVMDSPPYDIRRCIRHLLEYCGKSG